MRPPPGRSTVPRTELWAATAGLSHCAEGAAMRVIPDARYVMHGQGPPHRRRQLHNGANGDLWKAFDATVADRRLTLDLEKVRAHAEELVLTGRMPLQRYLGNALADALRPSGHVQPALRPAGVGTPGLSKSAFVSLPSRRRIGMTTRHWSHGWGRPLHRRRRRSKTAPCSCWTTLLTQVTT